MIFDPNNGPVKKDKYFVFKRCISFIIDVLMLAAIYLSLLFSLGHLSIREIAKDNIVKINEIYATTAEAHGMSTTLDPFLGVAELDRKAYIKYEVEENGLDVEKAMDKFYEIEKKVNDDLNKNAEYRKYYNKFYITDKIVEICCMLVPLLVFQLIIPLCLRKRQTLGMMIFKLSIVKKKDNVYISQYQVLLRFFIIFITEYLLVSILLGITGILIVLFLSIVIMLITPNKLSLHDAMMLVRVVKANEAYTEAEEIDLKTNTPKVS